MLRKMFASCAALVAAATLSAAPLADRPIETDALPEAAQTFIRTHFDGVKIAYAEVDEELFGAEYSVRLADGTEIEFDKSGEWKKVESEHAGLPASVLPAAIGDYLTGSYAGRKVEKIERKRRGYEVELVRGPELLFDRQGKFLRVDR